MGRRALFLISLHLYKNNISGWDLWSTILQLYETQALSWYRHHGAVILRDDCRKAGPSIWDSFEAMGVYVGLRCGWSVCLWCFKQVPICQNGSHVDTKVAFWCLGHLEKNSCTHGFSFRRIFMWYLDPCLELCTYVYKWSEDELTVIWSSHSSWYVC